MNHGYGHVRPRYKVKVRCGGPGICMECSLEADQKKLDQTMPADELAQLREERDRLATEVQGLRVELEAAENSYAEQCYDHHANSKTFDNVYQQLDAARVENARLVGALKPFLGGYEGYSDKELTEGQYDMGIRVELDCMDGVRAREALRSAPNAVELWEAVRGMELASMAVLAWMKPLQCHNTFPGFRDALDRFRKVLGLQ